MFFSPKLQTTAFSPISIPYFFIFSTTEESFFQKKSSPRKTPELHIPILLCFKANQHSAVFRIEAAQSAASTKQNNGLREALQDALL